MFLEHNPVILSQYKSKNSKFARAFYSKTQSYNESHKILFHYPKTNKQIVKRNKGNFGAIILADRLSDVVHYVTDPSSSETIVIQRMYGNFLFILGKKPEESNWMDLIGHILEFLWIKLKIFHVFFIVADIEVNHIHDNYSSN